MANVREIGGNTASSAAAGAEALAAAKKSAELAAGQVMIAEAAKRTAEQKENMEREHAEEKKEAKREEPDRDTPELSRQSKWFGIEGKLLENAEQKWVLEMEQELWEALLEWFPTQDTDISRQLEELSRLYLALLEAVLTHTAGEEQEEQLSRLQEVLARKLNLLLDTNLKELTEFLEQTGQKEVLQKVKASVYTQTTGKSISYREADEFYARGKTDAKTNFRFFMPESKGQISNSGRYAGSTFRSSSLPSAEEGILYKPAKGGNVQINQEFDTHRKLEEMPSVRRSMVSGTVREGSAGRVSAGGNMIFTGRELAGANAFASHINGSGNLLSNPALSARNEEVVGFLTAVTSIKGQVYASGAGRESTLRLPLQNAVNRLVDFYLTQKGIYKVYNYTTNVYEKTGSPQRALEEGLEYAYRRFLAKKEDVAYQEQASYAKQAGFFQSLLQGQAPEADLKKGMRILEENWREFLRAAGEYGRKEITLKMQKYSPWGALLEPGEVRREQKGKKGRLLLTEAAAVAAFLVIYACYRLFFG